MMFKKLLPFSLAALYMLPTSLAEEQTLCPIMIEDEIDVEDVVEFEGTKIYMCCGGCSKAWKSNPKYYLKVGRELKLIPQLENISEELQKELDEIELMEQRYCAIRKDTVVAPNSPSIEYEGKKIYFFKQSDIDRKWNKDPQGAFEKAKEAGVLPQFDKE